MTTINETRHLTISARFTRIGLVVLAVMAVATALAVGVQSGRDDESEAATSVSGAPAGLVAGVTNEQFSNALRHLHTGHSATTPLGAPAGLVAGVTNEQFSNALRHLHTGDSAAFPSGAPAGLVAGVTNEQFSNALRHLHTGGS